MTTRYRQLAAHIRSLNDDDLNDLLVDLPGHRFTALVKVALAHPVVPVGLELRLESAAPGPGWMVLAGDAASPTSRTPADDRRVRSRPRSS